MLLHPTGMEHFLQTALLSFIFMHYQLKKIATHFHIIFIHFVTLIYAKKSFQIGSFYVKCVFKGNVIAVSAQNFFKTFGLNSKLTSRVMLVVT